MGLGGDGDPVGSPERQRSLIPHSANHPQASRGLRGGDRDRMGAASPVLPPFDTLESRADISQPA